MKMVKKLIVSFLAAGSMLSASLVSADSDNAELKAAVNQEVKRMMVNGDFDGLIQQGIEAYIVKSQQEAENRKNRAANEKAKKVRPIDPERDHIEGNPDAIISLVEYSDFECPFCKRHHKNVQKLIKNNKGKVNWVYRHFPLSFHNPGAASQAEATECAAKLGGNDAFWKYTHTLYERTASGGNGFPVDKLTPLAVELGLDEEKFNKCLLSGEMKQRVQDDIDNGMAAGVSGTPGGILINNKTGEILASPGALPVAMLQRNVDKLLASKKK